MNKHPEKKDQSNKKIAPSWSEKNPKDEELTREDQDPVFPLDPIRDKGSEGRDHKQKKRTK